MKNTNILVAIFVTAAALSACSQAPDTQARPATGPSVRVIAEALQYEHARTRVEAVGTSRARLSAEIYPATSGAVIAVDFEPGQFVSAGDPLIELDRREQQLAVRLAKLKLEDSKRLFDRYQRSANSGAVLPTVLDAARSAVEMANVELDRARLALEERTVVAVFDGFVGSTDIDVGDRVTPSSLITTLDDRRSLLVSFELPEVFVGELSVGRTVGLETWSTSTGQVAGDIVDIGSRIDPRTRTFIARAKVHNSDDALRPGMSFRVGLDVQGKKYAVVSETGLQWGADGAYVWSIVDGVAARVPVQVIERRDGRILIDGDLEIGDIIVVEGTQRMRDGTAVSHDTPKMAVRSDEGVPQPIVGSAVTPD
jgi:RND family efflux transporter MFP subunit